MDFRTLTKRDSLSTECSRAFSMILTLGGGQDLGDFQAVRSRLTQAFGRVESTVSAGGYTAEDVRLARYALTAFVDEMIARSGWVGKAEWALNPLSLVEFNDNNAGDGFFIKLEEIRRQAEAKPELLEVYFTCLALGFEGKYALADRQERHRLIKDVGQELERVRPGATELSPHWRSPEQLAELVGGQLPLGVITAVAAGLVCIAFIALNFLLNGEANRLISRF